MTKRALAARAALVAATVALSSPALAADPCQWLSSRDEMFVSIHADGASTFCYVGANYDPGREYPYYIGDLPGNGPSCKNAEGFPVAMSIMLYVGGDLSPSFCAVGLGDYMISSLTWGRTVSASLWSSGDNELVITGLSEGVRRYQTPWVVRIRPAP